MTAVLCATVFFAVVVCAIAEQKAAYRCSYDDNGARINLVITGDESDYSIQQLVGKDSDDDVCVYEYTSGDTLVIPVFKTKEDPITSCGLTLNTAQQYELKFATSSCKNCLIDSDRAYSIDCIFDKVDTEQSEMITADAIGVDDDLKDGDPIQHAEDVSLTIYRISSDDTLPVPLGTGIHLHAILTLQGHATALRITKCFATNTDESVTVDLIENGCTSPGLGIMKKNTGFKKHNIGGSYVYVAASPNFPAFIFHNKDNEIVFKCIAKFCYKGALECDKSCESEDLESRKRRAVKNEREQSLIFVMKVTTDNTTTVSAKPADKNMSPSECSHRTYIIGLVIVGCVLILTFVVSLALFFALRRNRDVSSKRTGFDNKCMT